MNRNDKIKLIKRVLSGELSMSEAMNPVGPIFTLTEDSNVVIASNGKAYLVDQLPYIDGDTVFFLPDNGRDALTLA